MPPASDEQTPKPVPAVASTSDDTSGDSDTAQRCGIFGWSPACLQPFRSFALLFLCIIICNVTCSLLGSYHNAMVSTFEKRFGWKTRTVGFILSANDYGYLASVLFTAHFGGMSHRPRLLAACSCLYGITGILYFMPYALYGAKFPTEVVFRRELNLSESSDIAFCRSADSKPVPTLAASLDVGEESEFQANVAFVIFMLSGIIQGVAVGPFWNVGYALIDDMTKQWSGVFIGLYTMLRAIGPIIGYQLGSATTKLNENLSGTLESFAGSQKSPLWIGAWWLGYLASGIVVICFSIPLFLFPRNVPLKINTDPSEVKSSFLRKLLTKSGVSDDILQQEENADPDSKKQEMTFVGLFKSLKRLFSNKIFICLLVGNLFEFIGLNTPINYLAKYLEHHFDLMQSEASRVTGIIIPVGFGLGLGLSILVSFRFQMSMYSLARFHAFIHLIGIVRYFGSLLFQCPTPQVVTAAGGAGNGSFCGSCSSCSSDSYFPVCDGNVTYFSPCAAGCVDSLTSGCACVGGGGGGVARGTCEGACYASVAAYAAFNVFLMMLQSSARTQEAVINLRCVQPRDKALALAASSFSWGLVSSFLPPIIGAVFDKICLIRSGSGSRSYCEMYDRVKFRYAFHLLSGASHTIACVFFFLVWYHCAKRYGRGETEKTVELPMDDAHGDVMRPLKGRDEDCEDFED